MSVIFILILASLTMALLFLGGFIWAVRSGQFEDTHTPSMRVLTDEPGNRGGNSLNSSPKDQEEKS
jgi:cbb3-type cytochrome oxidase maturation protein